MPQNTLTPKSLAPTAERLAQVAADLLDEGGPASVTMRAVGDRAGLSAMAVYRHYENRDALLLHVVERGFTEVAVRFAASNDRPVQEALDAIVDAFVDLAVGRPHLFRMLFTEPREGARDLAVDLDESPTLSVVMSELRRGVDEGVFVEHDVAEVALASAAMLQGLCLARLAGRLGMPTPKFRALVHRSVELVLRGIRA